MGKSTETVEGAVFQPTYGGGNADAFVTELNPAGSALVYSTYLGGSNTDGGASIAVDRAGNADITGWTLSTNFPTRDPIQATLSSGNDSNGYQNSDVFVATLNSAGSGLVFSTYLGGKGDDYGFGIALGPSGNVYVAGYTGSKNFPTTTGAYQTSPGNGFVAEITAPAAAIDSLSVTGFPSTTTAGVAGSLTVTALNADGSTNTGYTGTVSFTSSDPHAVLPAPYTFTAADQGVHTFTATLQTAGVQTITATDTVTSSTTGTAGGIVVNPAVAAKFILSAPSSVASGAKFSLTLTVEDAYGNVVTGYTGTVHFSSSDSTATLPANYTFTSADAGVHTFSNAAILKKKGTQTITVTDTNNSALTATDDIRVS